MANWPKSKNYQEISCLRCSFFRYLLLNIRHYFFIALNSSFCSCTYFFSSLEQGSPKNNESRLFCPPPEKLPLVLLLFPASSTLTNYNWIQTVLYLKQHVNTHQMVMMFLVFPPLGSILVGSWAE